MSLPPDQALQAHVAEHRVKKSFFQPIPSTCTICNEDLASKTALAKHEREAHPKEPPFTDELRETYLELVRAGARPYKAARTVGVSPYTIKRAKTLDPSFAEAFELAEEEYAEVIEERLVARALADDNWAIKEFLSKRSKSRWNDDKNLNIIVSGTIEHRANLLPHEQDIMALRDTIRERARLNGTQLALENPNIIDAKIVE